MSELVAGRVAVGPPRGGAARFAGIMAAERIKLMSVRSPWWCAGLAVLGVVGLTILFVLLESANPAEGGGNPFQMFALVLVMVLAAVSVTTEYRYSTIRTTFEAAPNRTLTMIAKAVVVAAACGLIGLVAAFGSWAAVWLLLPGADVALRTLDDWRMVAGAGVVFAAGAVLALAVGMLVRHTAAAVSIVLVWVLLGEQLISVIPGFGTAVQPWLPFVNAGHATGAAFEDMSWVLSPWGSMAYFAAIAVGLFAVALAVVNRRDA
jgi:ABC-2 type transport system permease protein